MDPQKQREIARRGGKAAHAKGVAHKYSADEARSAGRKGGQAISADRSHMAEIGRLGGLARRAARAPESATPTPQSQPGFAVP